MITVYIESSPAESGKNIYIVDERNGKKFIAKTVELEFEELVPGGVVTGPTVRLPWNIADATLRAFSDALTQARIEPSEKPFVVGKLEATENHLQDMRRLVFEKKK